MNAYLAEIIAADRMAEIDRELERAGLVAAARRSPSRTGHGRVTRLVIAVACLAFAAYQWIGLGA
jgi:hypothetical protein